MPPIAVIAQAIFGKYVAHDVAQRLFGAAVPGVVAKMHAAGMDPATTPRKVIVRDALFRLIRSVIPSGDLADFLRDLSDDRVVAEVEKNAPENADLARLVRATAQAYVELVF